MEVGGGGQYPGARRACQDGEYDGEEERREESGMRKNKPRRRRRPVID